MLHVTSVGQVPATACPLPQKRRPQKRRSREPWAPSVAGPYKLPRAVQERLAAALAGFRNREAAFTLAAFLGRFWSTPMRLLTAFPIDRRALAEHEALGLTEARVRGAIAVLVEVGFLARYEPDPGRRYQRTEGGLQRRPILFRFGEDYAPAFAQANARAQAARGAPAPARLPAPRPKRPPAVLGGPANREQLAPPRLTSNSPRLPSQLAQKQNPSGSVLFMGDKNRNEPASPLEAALERLRRGVLS